MENAETERFLVSCHRQQQELLSSLLGKVMLSAWPVGASGSGSGWVVGRAPDWGITPTGWAVMVQRD